MRKYVTIINPIVAQLKPQRLRASRKDAAMVTNDTNVKNISFKFEVWQPDNTVGRRTQLITLIWKYTFFTDIDELSDNTESEVGDSEKEAKWSSPHIGWSCTARRVILEVSNIEVDTKLYSPIDYQ
jgi:hypothetical protein